MRKLGCGMFVFFFVISIAIYGAFIIDNQVMIINDRFTSETETIELTEKKLDLKSNSVSKDLKASVSLGEGLHTFIGQTVEFVETKWGEPERIDLSAYDYDWWIYPNAFKDAYVQIGVEDGQIRTIYGIGEGLPTGPIQIGTSRSELSSLFSFDQEVSFNLNNSSFQFKLSDEDLEMRPIIQVNGVFIQLYFDLFTQKLSSIRYLDSATIVKHRPYSVVYRGNLIEPRPLTNEQWREIEKGSSLQIFEITNKMRKRHELSELTWDVETAYVAFQHSEEMQVNNFFSHTSPNNGELKDRLKKQGVLYQLAGENIAAKYVDGIAAVEGWLNSEGHRINLLHEDFTHLGVGVSERYYTQNFITPWE